MHAPLLERRRLVLFFLLYLGFVVYGSLVPFELRPLTLEQAVWRFRHITYLNLGAASRADWIANLVLYVPLAFFGCAAALGLRRTRRTPGAVPALVLALCVAVAVAVEFVQQFFAPRTVSLNDLLAETLGSLGGIGLWLYGRSRIVRLLDSFARGGLESLRAAATAYALVYCVLALFPYDFVVSGDELATRLTSPNLGWLLASACGGGMACSARLAGEVLAVAPLGLLLVLIHPDLGGRRLFLLGLGLGTGVEIVQIFLFSGTAQGLSVLTRGLGLAAGGMAGQLLRRRGIETAAHLLRRAIPALSLPFVLTLAAINGWFASPWLPFSRGLARIGELRFIPFYYHYYTSEPTAMASLLANTAMYAPVGIAVWAWRRCRRLPDRGGAGPAALLAVLLALPLELGKLWLAGRHPDLTNLLIAAAAAAFSHSLVVWLGRIPAGTARPPAVPQPQAVTPPAAPPLPAPSTLLRRPAALAGIPPLIAAAAGWWSSPLALPWLLALIGYAAVLWRHPLAWLFAVPALLPTLDLAARHGRLPLDEFDLLVLTTLAVVPLHLAGTHPRPWPHPLVKAGWVLLWVSWLCATYRGFKGAGVVFIPASSHSPMAAWQVGKGLLWALLLVPLLRRIPVADLPRARDLVYYGMLAALAGVVTAVVWERHLFVGLTDFDTDFRVTGTFASMQTGGAYLEAFLAFAFPFLAVWVLTRSDWRLTLPGLLLGGVAGYAMLATFARGGYAGMAVGLVVVAVGSSLPQGGKLRRWATLTAMAAVVAAVAVPVVSEGFARYRLERSSEDMYVRWQHWRQALDLMDGGWVTSLTGTGFGRYPTDYLLYGDHREPPGGYAIRTQDGNRYLYLLPGESVYLDQRVAVAPHTRYRLGARIRVEQVGDGLTVPLCEKALLYSFACEWFQLTPPPPADTWRQVQVILDSNRLGAGGPWPHRPVKLSLYNAGKRPVAVDDVSLRTADGRELIANGDFGQGTAFWLFVTDRDLAWHIHQAGIEVYFAQGWLGLLALLGLLYGTLRILLPGWHAGQSWALALGGGLAGFVTVSLTGSTMDAARSSMLFYGLAFCAVWLTSPGARS